MVQLRTVADASRCLLLNRPRSSNLACPKDQLGSQSLPISVRLLKDSFVSRKRRSTFTFWHGTHLNGLGSARVRRGSGTWEIDKLYLPEDSSLYHVWSDCRGGVGEADVAYPDDGKQEVLELLEGLTRHAGTLGAQKLYLRVPWGSPVIDIAKQDGFFPYLGERLLVGNGFTNTQPPEANLKLRPRLPQDEYPLFQLYSACTPSSVRAGLGMTLAQWGDGRERQTRRATEEVYEAGGRLMAWLGSSRHMGQTQFELMVHPDERRAVPELLEHCLSSRGVQAWLVPDYQEFLMDSLVHRGFKEVAYFCMLIKAVAARVKSPLFAHAEARVW